MVHLGSIWNFNSVIGYTEDFSIKITILNRMSIATTGHYDTQKYDVKSFVLVTHTEALSVGRGFIAGITGIFGGSSDVMNKKVDDVTNKLLAKLKEKIGPGEKLVGVRFEFAEFARQEANSFLSGIATGTLISPKQGGMSGGKRAKTRRMKRL